MSIFVTRIMTIENKYYIINNNYIFHIKNIIDITYVLCDIIYLLNDVSISKNIKVQYTIKDKTLYLNNNKANEINIQIYNEIINNKNTFNNIQKVRFLLKNFDNISDNIILSYKKENNSVDILLYKYKSLVNNLLKDILKLEQKNKDK